MRATEYEDRRGLLRGLSRIAAWGLMVLGLAVGCGETDAQVDKIVDGPTEASEPGALAMESVGSCRIDADCKEGRFCYQRSCVYECKTDGDCEGDLSCSRRGECRTGSTEGGETQTLEQAVEKGRPSQALRDIEITESPETAVDVGPDQKTVTFEWKLSGESPADGIAYRVERSDGRGDPAQLRYSDPGKSFEVELKPGDASPTAEQPGPVEVTVRSPLGDLSLLMRPEPSWTGEWRGEVELDSLGGQSLPLEVWLVGDSYENMKVALPVRPGHLFSPRDDYRPNRRFEVAELRWNDSLSLYQARFTHEYRFESGTFAGLPTGQIERTIRLDVKEEALKRGEFEGRVMDLWRGVTETQTKFGDRKVDELIQYGDFQVERAAELPVDSKKLTVKDGRTTDPGLLALKSPEACSPAAFEVGEVQNEEGDETWSCDGIDSAKTFEMASATERADCALAIAKDARSGETTSEQLQAYFDDNAGEGSDESFQDFLAACADEQDTACQPLERAPCAMQTLSHASRGLRSKNVGDADTLSNYQGAVMEEMQTMASEAYLAKQLGAFHTDLETRKSWLKKSTAPKQFVRQIEKKTKETLDRWRKDVLETQSDLVSRFFRRNALVTLGRSVDGEAATRARKKALMQGGMLWRATVESMTLAAKRWNRLVRDKMERRERMAMLGEQTVEMYVLLGLLSEYNRSAGASSQAALLVGDFADMLEAIEKLGTPFTKALYARDAEVVTATSLDPLTDNDSLMSKRRKEALELVDTARTEIESLIEEMQAEALKEARVRQRLQRRLRESANRIATLCGLPEDCSVDNLAEKPDKCLKVDRGQCGLQSVKIEEGQAKFNPAKVKTSEAGSKALDILEAYKNLEIAQSDLDGHLQKARLDYEEMKAFKKDIETWDKKRREGVKNLKKNLEKQNDLKDEQLQTLVDNLAKRAEERQKRIDSRKDNIEKWDQIRVDGANSSFRSELREISLEYAADSAENLGNLAGGLFRATAEGLPDVVGTSNDVSAPASGVLHGLAAAAEFAGAQASAMLDASAKGVAAERRRQEALTEAELAKLRDESELESLVTDAELAKLQDRMEKVDTLTEVQITKLENALRVAKAQREAHLAYERDLAKLREKRTNYKKTLVDASGLRLKRERARFRILQRVVDYKQVVQKGKLEASRFRELQTQLSNINTLLGGPSVVFLRFQELRFAEQKLAEAREALMDWLVLLEYYAVRPFIKERIQILLARNPYQLSAIADRLQELEESCGGSERSKASVELSVRDDLMQLDRPQKTLDGEMSSAERFRESLETGYVPVDRNIRYSTSASLDQILGGDQGKLAATFSLRLDKFANLPLACNAKLDSMDIKLVGDIGEGQPSVSLLYDGSAQLRSCQPKIDEYVESFAPGLTSYGTRTYLDTAGRSASPVASINEFPEKKSGTNRTLAGLPLASQYTVLVDTQLPSNKDLDWSKLEDIEIRLDYTYQDLFPEKCD